MKEQVSSALEDYQIQRQYREQKRRQYLRRFQVLRQKMGLTASSSLPETQAQRLYQPVPIVATTKNSSSDQELLLLRENEALKSELAEIEKTERQKLNKFKEQISVVKSKYISRIKSISDSAKNQKAESDEKAKKLEGQIKSSLAKNAEIQNQNKLLQGELDRGSELMSTYSTEINKQYKQKLEEFETIFESSNEKIEAMESQFNDDEFVENTINNEQLIESIKANAQKADSDIDKILSDYKELLEGKTEILQQPVSQNNQMKEKQIAKMSELEDKLKNIFDKLNEEKKIYMAENSRMAEELIEVKNLLTSSLGQGEEQ